MNVALTNLGILICMSSMLCAAMTLSFFYFGRKRYTLMWAISAGGAAVQWSLNAIANVTGQKTAWVMIVAGILVIIDSTLLAIGSRDRAGLPLRLPLFVSLALVMVIGVAVTVLMFHNTALRGFVVNSYCAIMMVVAGGAFFPRHRVISVPEMMMFVVLLVFALLCMALAMLSLGAGQSGSGSGAETFRAVLVIGLPAAYSAMGISVMFVLATDLNNMMQSLITRDPLTGVLNRRGFGHQAVSALANARRRDHCIALALIDIDHFKSFNARCGYPLGDRVLAGFADVICTNVREEDVVGRIDGNVFAVLLIDADADQACEVMDRICRDLALLSIDGETGLGLTATFGVAADLSDETTISDLSGSADTALQRARNARPLQDVAA